MNKFQKRKETAENLLSFGGGGAAGDGAGVHVVYAISRGVLLFQTLHTSDFASEFYTQAFTKNWLVFRQVTKTSCGPRGTALPFASSFLTFVFSCEKRARYVQTVPQPQSEWNDQLCE